MSILPDSRLATDGGKPVRQLAWPPWPVWDETEEIALRDVLHSGQWWSVGGKRVPEFEKAFARLHDAQYGICVTNGSAALEVGLRALGIGQGDEVIVPPYTFIATASSVLAVGATPVFVDIEPDSLNINPALVEAALTPRTKAIIPVHIAGCPADMDGILAAARKYHLAVIEDAAQAHMAEWDGRKVGALGNLGTFSFQASKNLNAGEGGIILTNDEKLADRLWSVANVGRTRDGKWYEHSILGSNYRLTEWQAAVLLTQLARLPEQAARRQENAAYLTTRLAAIPGIRPLPVDPRVTGHARHLYIFRYDPTGFRDRPLADFLRALDAEGVPCSAGYGPLYREGIFQENQSLKTTVSYSDVFCPVCEQVSRDAVWLPQHLLLGEKGDMDDIGVAIRKIQKAWA